MLTQEQIKLIAEAANKKIDLPFVSETREQALFEKTLLQVDGLLEGVLEEKFSPDTVVLMRTLLGGDNRAREKALTDFLQSLVGESLIEKINEKVDIPLLSEQKEEKIMRIFSDFLIAQLVSILIKNMMDAKDND